MFKKITALLLSILLLTSSIAIANEEVATEDPRQARLKEYLAEFMSASVPRSYPKIYEAIINSLNKLPEKEFYAITDPNRPIIFLVTMSSGLGRLASAIEFSVDEDDPPMLQEGFFLIHLGDELNLAEDVQSIEGIVLHEIAHRVLEHLRRPKYSCEFEREANQLVKKWGYEQEYQKASDAFGAKKKGDSPCKDKLEAEAAEAQKDT